MLNSIKNLLTRRNLGIAGLTVLGFLVFIVAVNFGLGKYNESKQWQEMKKAADAFQKAEQELYQKMMGDTYGGKTPQETLDMFISAVEAGDYELASKYFVTEKQEEELKSLQNAPIENIRKVMFLLKEVTERLSKKEPLWESKDQYIITTPILADFIKYPNGIWKISEI